PQAAAVSAATTNSTASFDLAMEPPNLTGRRKWYSTQAVPPPRVAGECLHIRTFPALRREKEDPAWWEPSRRPPSSNPREQAQEGGGHGVGTTGTVATAAVGLGGGGGGDVRGRGGGRGHAPQRPRHNESPIDSGRLIGRAGRRQLAGG